MKLALQRFALGRSSSRCCTLSRHTRGHPLAWSWMHIAVHQNGDNDKDGNTMIKIHLKYSPHCTPNLQLIWIELAQHQMRVSSGRATCSHATSARSSNIPGWKKWLPVQCTCRMFCRDPQASFANRGSSIYFLVSKRSNIFGYFWGVCAYATSSLAGGYVSSRPGLPFWALNRNVVCGFKRKQQTCCSVLGCLGCTRITGRLLVLQFYHATWPKTTKIRSSLQAVS